jgi:hypothetical protein
MGLVYTSKSKNGVQLVPEATNDKPIDLYRARRQGCWGSLARSADKIRCSKTRTTESGRLNHTIFNHCRTHQPSHNLYNGQSVTPAPSSPQPIADIAPTESKNSSQHNQVRKNHRNGSVHPTGE